MKTKYSLGSRAGARNAALLLSIIALLGSGSTLPAASLSELLEQGIYSEQTKGDLDGAVEAYQQVVKDAKAGEYLAAQAQYRLGVCYYKKKDYTAATAAFQKLVQDYPNEKDLVRMANEYLTGTNVLLPAPWVDGEELQLNLAFATGVKLGVSVLTANADELNGRKIWQLSSRLYALGTRQWSRVEVEPDSFKPIHSLWRHSLLGEADTTYSATRAELKLKGADAVKSVELDGVVYDNEEVMQMIRRLPLASNYTANIRVFSGLGGGSIIPLKVDVTGPEKVTVPAGTFDCYKVFLSLVKQTFWYSADEHRYLVKFDANSVVAELKSIQQHKHGESSTYQDPTFGFSLSLPSGWVVDKDSAPEDKKGSFILLDPDDIAVTLMTVRSVKDLKPEAQSSVRAWADAMVAEAAKRVKDFAVRPDSWKEFEISGRPAVSVVADCVRGNEKEVACATYVLGERDASEFYFFVAPASLDSFRPKFDAVVNTYVSK